MRRGIALAAIALLLAGCGEAELTRDEANWCRAYVTPNQISLQAAAMGIDIDPALTEANIAYDLEGLVSSDPIAPFDAFWDVMEADDGYRTVCRTMYEENA